MDGGQSARRAGEAAGPGEPRARDRAHGEERFRHPHAHHGRKRAAALRARYPGFLRGRCQPGLVTCFFSVSVRPPGGTSFVIVAPAPIVAPRPTVTGATSCTSEPMWTSSSITVRCLLAPS